MLLMSWVINIVRLWLYAMFDRTRLLITGQVAVENISKRCVKPGEVACGRRHKTDAFISFFSWNASGQN